MNKIIMDLESQKLNKGKELKNIQYELNIIEENLNKSINKETKLLNNVLKNNLIEIIEIIHKSGLKCNSVYNAETYRHDTIYRISDGHYFVDIKAKDGTIVKDLSNINNDVAKPKFYKDVENLLFLHIIPYCENKKLINKDEEW